jgi:hypothetical protein
MIKSRLVTLPASRMAAAFTRRYREPGFLRGRLASTKAAARTIVWPQEIFPTGPSATQQQDSLMVKGRNRCPSVGASKLKKSSKVWGEGVATGLDRR